MKTCQYALIRKSLLLYIYGIHFYTLKVSSSMRVVEYMRIFGIIYVLIKLTSYPEDAIDNFLCFHVFIRVCNRQFSFHMLISCCTTTTTTTKDLIGINQIINYYVPDNLIIDIVTDHIHGDTIILKIKSNIFIF